MSNDQLTDQPLALARKWRPRNFEQFIGQEHVVRAITNALTQNRLHHAYLFSGTRGVGKTTIARILAKCLNCERGITPSPCGQCQTCQVIDQGRFIDLIEVDAASRTKVEDTRELLDNVQYAPTAGRYKIYLIDEAHMLSGHSFNALLKTLEEPPPHVIFLLATTDPQKLPITVLSRCLQFHLKNLNPEQIQRQMAHILQQEAINYDEAALNLLAIAAQGSMRDGLSLLDQAIAFGNGKIAQPEVANMLGTIDRRHIDSIIQALASRDVKQLRQVVAHLSEQGMSFTQALDDLLDSLHQLTICQMLPVSDDNSNLAKLSQQINPEDIQLYYQIGLIGKRDLPLAPTERIGFEMILLRMLAFIPESLATRPEQPPSAAKTTPVPAATKPVPNTRPATQPASSWEELINCVGLQGAARALATHCVLLSQDEEHIQLMLEPNQKPLLTSTITNRLNTAFSEYYGRPVKIDIQVGMQPSESPATKARRQAEEKQATAVQAVQNDQKIQAIISQFNAKILADSIRPVEES